MNTNPNPILLTLILCACATPYQEMGFAGGFEQRMITEDLYAISFRGNGFTSPAQVKEMSILRAAEIGSKLGFSHFVIVGQQDASRKETVTTGTTSNTTGSVYGTNNYATYSGTTNTYTNTMPVFKPGIEVGVRYFEGPPQGRYLEILKVETVLARLGPKYGIKSKP